MGQRDQRPSTGQLAADELYAELVAAHAGLRDEESAELNARLLLLLIDRIGDPAIVRALLRRAATREGAAPSGCVVDPSAGSS